MSTIIALVQTANFFRDRVRVRITYQRGMEAVNIPRYAGPTLTHVNVVNVGRRKLTITMVAANRLHDRAWIFTDATPRLPCVLEEGEQIQVLVNESGVDYGEVIQFVAYNVASHRFICNVAPWYLRLGWRLVGKYRRRQETT